MTARFAAAVLGGAPLGVESVLVVGPVSRPVSGLPGLPRRGGTTAHLASSVLNRGAPLHAEPVLALGPTRSPAPYWPELPVAEAAA